MKTANPFRAHVLPAFQLGWAALFSQFLAPSAFAAGAFYRDNVAGAGLGTAGGTGAATTAGPQPGWNTVQSAPARRRPAPSNGSSSIREEAGP